MSLNDELELHHINSRLVMQDADGPNELDPIVGYAREPLLSVTEACVPLVNIVDDIFMYIVTAVECTPQTPADGLTRDESAAIYLYTMEWPIRSRSLYLILNETLRNPDREQLRPWFRYLKLFLTGLVKIPCVPRQTIWRGIKRNIFEQFSRGTEVVWWSFSSCTGTLEALNNNLYLGTEGDRTLFSIDALNARSIRNHSYYQDEDEILLLPGTRVKVKSVLHQPCIDILKDSNIYVFHFHIW